ncbi:MAG: anti-sigma factor [Cypionkella sp.]|nr:anti-sigma factor [Cypionkella sp.]
MSAPVSDTVSDDDADMLAAEYVLGVLDAPDRARAEDMARHSPQFAARIAAWEAQLSPLVDEVAPIVPAPDLLHKINARLFGARAGFWARLLPKTRMAGSIAAVLGTGAMAALSVIVIAVMLHFSGGIDRPLQSATLIASGSEVRFQAQLDGGIVTVLQTAGAPPMAGRSYELWLIDGDAAPLSLGLVSGRLTLNLPPANAGFVLAVTDEPFGGGPGGKPSGAVIAAGSFPEI